MELCLVPRTQLSSIINSILFRPPNSLNISVAFYLCKYIDVKYCYSRHFREMKLVHEEIWGNFYNIDIWGTFSVHILQDCDIVHQAYYRCSQPCWHLTAPVWGPRDDLWWAGRSKAWIVCFTTCRLPQGRQRVEIIVLAVEYLRVCLQDCLLRK